LAEESFVRSEERFAAVEERFAWMEEGVARSEAFSTGLKERVWSVEAFSGERNLSSRW